MATRNRNAVRAARGKAAIKAHPDYVATDITTSVTDTIADVLHGARAMGLFDGPYTPDSIVAKALDTYEGDAEDDEPAATATTHVPDPATARPEDAYGWATTGALNSRDHIAEISPWQNKAICGTGIAGTMEIRPRVPNLCPRCERQLRLHGLDWQHIGIENDLTSGAA